MARIRGTIFGDIRDVIEHIETTQVAGQHEVFVHLLGIGEVVNFCMKGTAHEIVLLAHRLLDLAESVESVESCEWCAETGSVILTDLGEHVCESCLTAIPTEIELPPGDYTIEVKS